MNIRISGVINDSIVDGPGLRYTIFTQGCPHMCEGCHNPESQDFNSGQVIDTEYLLNEIKSNPLLNGVTLSGGEPFSQPEACSVIAKSVNELGLSVWTYTGYTIEELLKENYRERIELLKYTDVLIDGQFVLSKRSLELDFCGSTNQRLIDVKKTMSTGNIVLWER